MKTDKETIMRHSWILWTLILAQTSPASLASPGLEGDDSARDAAIVEAALNYVDGFYEGNTDRIARGVHPSLQKVVVRSIPAGREFLDFMDQATLAEYARLGRGKKSADARKIDVTILDVYKNTAIVRIDSVDFLDHAQAAEINGEWRIINVLWIPHDSATAEGEVGPEDERAIEQAGLDYVDGFYAGNPEWLEKALHPRLQKVFVQPLPNGREIFRYATTDGMVEYVRTGQSKKPSKERKISVSILELSGNIATIRVDSADFVDFAHVARINGEWKIVNVLWAPQD